MNSPEKPPTVVDEIDLWLADLQAAGRSQRTIQTYRDALKNLRRFLADRHTITSPLEILPEHLESWQKRLVEAGCTAACINLYVRATQYWFEWQIKADRLFFNPAIGLVRPSAHSALGRCPSVDDMRRLLLSVNGSDVISLRDRALLETAYSTGARCEEIERLDDASVNLERRVVMLFGKGAKERVAPLTGAAVDSIAVYRTNSRPKLLHGVTDQPALFVSKRASRRLDTAAVAAVVKHHGARIGLKISPHDIRRAFITHLLLGGASVAHLRELLGHTGFSHLRAYLKLAPVDVLNAVKNSVLNQ